MSRKRLTTEEFIDKARTIHGDRYDYSKSAYTGSGNKLTIICSEHGEFTKHPYNHLNERGGCVDCNKPRPSLTLKQFVSKAGLKHGNKFDYDLVKYDFKNSNKPVEIYCGTHGWFHQSPHDHLLNKHGCPKCGGSHIDKAEFIRRSCEKHGNKYDYTKSIYVDTQTKVCIQCNKGHTFYQTPNQHMLGKGCSKCNHTNVGEMRRSNTSEFINKARKVHGSQYDYSLAHYIDNDTKIAVICQQHGEFKQKPRNHVQNENGCPKCKSSKGETKIRIFLTELSLDFEEQKTFEGCKSKNNAALRFDFFVNGAAIEFQGCQHFESVKFFGGEEGFKGGLERDQIKRGFCAKNNIPLLEIRFDDRKWKNKITKFLKL